MKVRWDNKYKEGGGVELENVGPPLCFPHGQRRIDHLTTLKVSCLNISISMIKSEKCLY